MPMMASLASNLILPKGLQTTNHLSQEMMARDQRPVIPAGESRQMMALSLLHYFHMDQPTVFQTKKHSSTTCKTSLSKECFQVQGALGLLVNLFS